MIIIKKWATHWTTYGARHEWGGDWQLGQRGSCYYVIMTSRFTAGRDYKFKSDLLQDVRETMIIHGIARWYLSNE